MAWFIRVPLPTGTPKAFKLSREFQGYDPHPYGMRPCPDFSLLPMIRMPGQYGLGAVELFGQHRARQQMRPRRPAEGEQQIGRVAIVIGMAIGSADHEAAFAHPVVAPSSSRSVPGSRIDVGGSSESPSEQSEPFPSNVLREK